MTRDPKKRTHVETWLYMIEGAVVNGECVEPVNVQVDEEGYGRIKVDGKQWRANRFAYFVNWGPIPEGYLVCHYCDNPSCVNPRHLWLGTATDNAHDRDGKKRHRTAPPEKTRHIGKANGSSKLTEQIVIDIRRRYAPSTKGNGKGSNIPQLAREYGVTPRAAMMAAKRQSWKHV